MLASSRASSCRLFHRAFSSSSSPAATRHLQAAWHVRPASACTAAPPLHLIPQRHLHTAQPAIAALPTAARALPDSHGSSGGGTSGSSSNGADGKARGVAKAAATAAVALALATSSFLGAPRVAWAEQDVLTREAPVDVMKAPPQLERLAPGLTAEEQLNIRIFQDNTPSVVNITNVRLVQDRFNLNVMKMPAGVGSGFIWDDKGHVVTNFHVVKGANEVRVTLLDQTSVVARLVGADPDKDVAVLQLDMPPERLRQLKPVKLGTSDELLVGQRVFAIGNPFGLDHTLTQGIISGLGRELDTGLSSIKNMIQTDAAINPGNSGGILLDTKGRVIGINTAIADPTGKGASSGVGFAIPISDVRGLVDQILQTGRVQRPALGVTIAPPQILQQLGVEGVLVLDVPEGSPAARAGLQPTLREPYSGRLILGDIIMRVDGKKVASYKDLVTVLDTKKVGDRIRLDILRGGSKTTTVEITLGERQLGLAE